MFIALTDKVISIIALLLLTPLLLIIAIFVYLDLGRPIIFKQKRVGLNGKVFEIYKFRSMKHSNSSKVLQAHEEEERISNLGNFLRLNNFDELPQLINVIKGHMSLVGPRPHELSQDLLFSNEVIYYKFRSRVKPGITGLAQANKLNGPLISKKMLHKRVKHDIYWVRKKSYCLYILILLQTFLMIIKK
jgi:putative colanic acid biosynthesis UDP-glucose lipid carrier transferase